MPQMDEGDVKAIDVEKGKVIWQTQLDIAVSSEVGVGPQTVLLGTTTGDIIALNKSDGVELWRNKATSEILAAPVDNGKVVVVQSIDSKAYGYDSKTG